MNTFLQGPFMCAYALPGHLLAHPDPNRIILDIGTKKQDLLSQRWAGQVRATIESCKKPSS